MSCLNKSLLYCNVLYFTTLLTQFIYASSVPFLIRIIIQNQYEAAFFLPSIYWKLRLCPAGFV